MVTPRPAADGVLEGRERRLACVFCIVDTKSCSVNSRSLNESSVSHELVTRRTGAEDHVAEVSVGDLLPHLVLQTVRGGSACCIGTRPDPGTFGGWCRSGSRKAPGEGHWCRRCTRPPLLSEPYFRFEAPLSLCRV